MVAMEIVAWIIAPVVTCLAGRGIYRLLFENWDDFCECLKYSVTPDIVSMFRGEYGQDFTQSLKLSLFLFMTFGSGVLTWLGIASIGS